MLPLPARANRCPPRTTTAPTGTSPRRPACVAAASACRIQYRSASVAGESAATEPSVVPEADRFTSSLPLGPVFLAGLGALRLAPAARGATPGARRLALLHIGFADDHGLRNVLHGPAGLEILVDLLAVHFRGRPDRRHTENQGPPEQHASESHSRLLARVERAVIPAHWQADRLPVGGGHTNALPGRQVTSKS